MSTLRCFLLMLLCIVGMACPAFAQHILACRGTGLVPIGGSSSLFQMQEGETYQVIGISVNVNLMFATPLGGADYNGDRFRVLDGGQYAATEVTLKNVTSKVTEHWEENKMGWRTKYSSYSADWTGELLATGVEPLVQCYAALEWYSDGQPVGTVAKIIGRLSPGRPVSIAFSVPISDSQRGGTYSFRVWSGAVELKTTEVQKPTW